LAEPASASEKPFPEARLVSYKSTSVLSEDFQSVVPDTVLLRERIIMEYFFLSYSRGESDHVKTFYERLCKAIGRKVGVIDYLSLGFMDETIDNGANWPEELGDALQRCRTIVCLYSPLYFNSPFCGKEYHIFQLRRELFVEQNSANGNPSVKHPPVIKPIVWYPFDPDQIPQAVNSTNYVLGRPDAIHNQLGVCQMLEELSKYKSEYNAFINLLANQIIETFKAVNLPKLEILPPLNEIPNYFKMEVPNVSVSSNGSEPTQVRKGGPKLVHFVYIAGSPSEIGDSRSQDPYEEEGKGDWKPYWPDEEPIGSFAQHVISDKSMKFESQSLAFSPDLADNIRRIENENSLVVLFVDSWTLKLSPYREILEKLDKKNYDNCGIIAPLNENDEESKKNKEELNELVQMVFNGYRKYNNVWARALFEGGINSLEKLEHHLKAVVKELQFQMIQLGLKKNKAFPRTPKSDIQKPQLY
jgi:FxsC-like protein